MKLNRVYNGGNGTLYFDKDLSNTKNPDQVLNHSVKILTNTIQSLNRKNTILIL